MAAETMPVVRVEGVKSRLSSKDIISANILRLEVAGLLSVIAKLSTATESVHSFTVIVGTSFVTGVKVRFVIAMSNKFQASAADMPVRVSPVSGSGPVTVTTDSNISKSSTVT